MLIVSGCLLGQNCKYSGGNNYNKELVEFLKDKEYKLVCPEELGGLSTPRDPSEIMGRDGKEVLKGKAKVVSKGGKDLTKAFITGAEKTLELAKSHCSKVAILKSRSPSCGSRIIYDGSFSEKLKKGNGVTGALLKENGILVLNEENYWEYI